MFKYNDYELLYLCSWHSEEALQILMEKYGVLIRYKLVNFHIQKSQVDDFYQEGVMLLQYAIDNYNENKEASFFTYFELLLERRIMRLLSNNSRAFNSVFLADPNEFDYPDPIDFEAKFYYGEIIKSVKKLKLNELKKQIFNEIFLEQKKVSDFAIEHKLDCKDVYNQVYLLRKKLRENLS